MKTTAILSAARIVDGIGSTDQVNRCRDIIVKKGLRCETLIVDPLSAGWHTPLETNHFRSGCSPISALHAANRMISEGRSDAVLISGTDHLRSGYTREERIGLMNIYPGDFSIPEGYTRLARIFMEYNGISEEMFRSLSEKLFANYLRTCEKFGTRPAASGKWKEPMTDLFLICDCANPVVDFDGMLLVGNAECVKILGMDEPVYVSGTGLGETEGDGKPFLGSIARFEHLRSAYDAACSEAGIDFRTLFLNRDAILEVYTCYPVIPMAFLLVTGIAGSIPGLTALLDTHDVTLTGGMNLARAPWDNPALNALIAAYDRIKTGPIRTACIHGNGGLGYKQGVAIISR
ncbi:MAG TPA: hypothetical protein PK859_06785 [Spirochaetota bacterium]|nr:hypothetical protein [Spirochaetota bacterium]